ncbi:nicotinic acetylcholine receptor subunit beta [Pluralibacter gergoviae]|uniref:hypothetical protein n=1 Tax=Pluralibacter gergoviae TaxID=61647 RepID=UPI000650CCD8|nr:hypothetical protein [Pluralibacter gergoviae]KMK16759.1 nicotinic acetylcholine receptor subunit beta [Pluralibacter gergoviae]OHY62426.1 nicotinic acetylcholine receptor subunit beta [Pluralibacter gergoviae]
MNTNICFPHPEAEIANAALLREESYPPNFTQAERTRERMTRARTGLVHVMSELLPSAEQEQGEAIHYWLDAVLSIVDITKIDAEGQL